MCNDSGQNKGTPRVDFGPARKYARNGASRHTRGWQENHPAAAAGEPTAPRAPHGSISRTPLAERLRRRVEEHER
jgi:hypothetical protein